MFFQMQLLQQQSYIYQSNEKSTYYLIIRLVRVNDFSSANTDRKSYQLNKLNEAHHIQAQDRQQLIFAQCNHQPKKL